MGTVPGRKHNELVELCPSCLLVSPFVTPVTDVEEHQEDEDDEDGGHPGAERGPIKLLERSPCGLIDNPVVVRLRLPGVLGRPGRSVFGFTHVEGDVECSGDAVT